MGFSNEKYRKQLGQKYGRRPAPWPQGMACWSPDAGPPGTGLPEGPQSDGATGALASASATVIQGSRKQQAG